MLGPPRSSNRCSWTGLTNQNRGYVTVVGDCCISARQRTLPRRRRTRKKQTVDNQYPYIFIFISSFLFFTGLHSGFIRDQLFVKEYQLRRCMRLTRKDDSYPVCVPTVGCTHARCLHHAALHLPNKKMNYQKIKAKEKFMIKVGPQQNSTSCTAPHAAKLI